MEQMPVATKPRRPISRERPVRFSGDGFAVDTLIS
jgi:hypothetical protein